MEGTQYIKDIFIVGAGGLGREVAGWIDTSQLKNQLNIKGFFDDNLNLLDNFHSFFNYKIVDKISENNLIEAKNILVSITDSEIKSKIFVWSSKSFGFNIESLIHPTAVIGVHCHLGEGIIISPNALISSFTSIEKGVFINCGSQIGHDVQIGKFTNIMAGVNIGGESVIGENVFIGTGAIILPRIKIIDNVKIGSGAVVLKSIKEAGTYFGNPAKRIF
jgi:sugar O-acyltransferase (sialic acid O-acetyltransferase NeuD family)